MKKVLAFSILLIFCVFIAACSGNSSGKLSGTYVNKDLDNTYMTFSGNKISYSLNGETYSGKYEIKGDKLITTASDGRVSELDFSQQGNTITILGAISFTKK